MPQEEKKIFAGQLFNPGDSELKEIKRQTHNLNLEYNRLPEDAVEQRNAILAKIIGQMGEGCFLQGPITFHYGRHTTIGKNFFANFNFTVQDDACVTIGDNCNFGPNVTIVTPLHPLVAGERRAVYDENGVPRHMCYARPVHIGNDCWLGANVVVCPGVTIGDGCVIGAGSVVTRDIPPDSVAVGNPCRVLRTITEKDSMVHKPEIMGGCSIIEG